MSARPLRTLIIGFGKMSSTYAKDPLMATYYPFATHAQVLVANPSFEWVGVVDPDPLAQDDATLNWPVSTVAADVNQLGELAGTIEVAVLATPPHTRRGLLDALPNLKAVLVEKPLACSLDESAEFLKDCQRRNITVQVNFWRRADEQFQQLSRGTLQDLIGKIQIAQGVYGNGLMNNGIHLIDFIRMLLGEVESVAPLGNQTPFLEGPIMGDSNPAFVLTMASGVVIPIQPLRFTSYREVGLELWGNTGHLAILNEGLTLSCRQRQSNRAMSNEYEISFDAADYLQSTVGHALYRMYDDLAAALQHGQPLCSTGISALTSTQIVEAIQESIRGQCVIAIVHQYKGL